MTELRLAIPSENYQNRMRAYARELNLCDPKTCAGLHKLEILSSNYVGWMRKVNGESKQNLNNKGELVRTFLITNLLSEESRQKHHPIDQVVGVVNIRITATDPWQHGGHIKLNIRPSERRKGHGTGALFLVLKICTFYKINTISIMCDAENIGAIKTIKALDGRLLSDSQENGKAIHKYEIAVATSVEKYYNQYQSLIAFPFPLL